ncbi:MAG TPA: SRPBCC domain-containing protein [Puia sp.]|nr:SRPBCC domain-containing protein [Puia sp.]
MKTIIKTDYHAMIEVHCSAQKAFDAICRVSAWWTENTDGDTVHSNGEFKVRFGETFSRFKIIEYIPGQKLVWYVIDCNLHWMKDKKEWKDTKILWQITGSGNSSRISMTHIGLNAGIECFEDCTKGWNHYVTVSLFKLIEDGKGEPDHKEYSALERQ